MHRLVVALTALVTMLAGSSAVVTGASYATTPQAQATVSSATSVVTRSSRRTARLHVPAIGVNAGIRRVGVRNGQLAIGGSVTDVYAWRQGVRPGQPGSAVLAGHTWSKGPGVFDRLGRLRPGNHVTVGRAAFRVVRVRRVHRLGAEEVRGLFSDRGRARLVLITCGDRNDTTGIYATRIIVNAKKVRRHRADG